VHAALRDCLADIAQNAIGTGASPDTGLTNTNNEEPRDAVPGGHGKE